MVSQRTRFRETTIYLYGEKKLPFLMHARKILRGRDAQCNTGE